MKYLILIYVALNYLTSRAEPLALVTNDTNNEQNVMIALMISPNKLSQ